MDMKYQYFISPVDEADLNLVTAGKPLLHRMELSESYFGHWSDLSGQMQVYWKYDRDTDLAQPLLLICRQEDQRRLFGRFSQVRSELSPLTAWCHCVTPEQARRLVGPAVFANLEGWEACWVGAVIAEAFLLAERSIEKIRLPTCTATQSFAVARTVALWGAESVHGLLGRYDVAQKLVRQRDSGLSRVRSELEPIWETLIDASCGGRSVSTYSDEPSPLVECLIRLRQLRSAHEESEALAFVEPLLGLVPEVRELVRFHEMSSEERLRLFDMFVSSLELQKVGDSRRRSALCLLAGYVSTVVAGGAPSLALSEELASAWPAVIAWAYVLGGVGERVTWTSAFDGLGRLISRELTRTLRLDEPPTCDFSMDEAEVLIDTKLSDPLVHLRVKQSRVLSASIRAGVNISIALADNSSAEQRRPAVADSKWSAYERSRERQSSVDLELVAGAIWRQLQPKLDHYLSEASASKEVAPVATGKTKARKKAVPTGATKEMWPRNR
jgi:hypothetical protein